VSKAQCVDRLSLFTERLFH